MSKTKWTEDGWKTRPVCVAHKDESPDCWHEGGFVVRFAKQFASEITNPK